jgi:prepilin-type N-terminal cleavage/methylation domain-containing protein
MNLTRYQSLRNLRLQQRAGFTLIELMVVITIIIILLTMTLLAVNFSQESDRVVSAAQQVKSFLEGARDRAIYSKEARGVRFFVSPENPRAVTTMAYIAPGGTWSSPENSANIDLLRVDGDSDTRFDNPLDVIRRVVGRNNPGWWNLKRRGWLVDGLRIRIPKGPTGTWYPLDTSLINISAAPTDVQTLLLQVPYADAGNLGQELAHPNLSYEIELPAKLLPLDPTILPTSVIIDLDGSKIPDSWRPIATGNTQFSGFMDVVFSPRGNVIGDAAGAGILHFYICDGEDSVFLKQQFNTNALNANVTGRIESTLTNTPLIPLDEVVTDTAATNKPVHRWYIGDNAYQVSDRRLVTIAAQTGNVTLHEVNSYTPTNASGEFDQFDYFDIDDDGKLGPTLLDPTAEPDGLADDPYAFAESGKVTN